MTIVQKAREFAANAHYEQKRKYTGEPYINHPAEVVSILKTVGASDNMIAAAWLHDVVEDCCVAIVTIARLFGEEVAGLVSDLSDISLPVDGSRASRKEIDRQHTAKASPDAKTIKLADLISNTSSIVEHDPHFVRVYLHEKARLLEVLKEGNPTLWKMAHDNIKVLSPAAGAEDAYLVEGD